MHSEVFYENLRELSTIMVRGRGQVEMFHDGKHFHVHLKRVGNLCGPPLECVKFLHAAIAKIAWSCQDIGMHF